MFIEHAKAIGMDTPGAIYNTDVRAIRPKVMTTKIYADKKKDSDSKKINKSDLPAPGSYNSDKSFEKISKRTIITAFS